MTNSKIKNKESISIVQKKMKTISQFGKVLQFFSPFLATKFCARIFSAPLNFKTPERELMYRKSAKNELVLIPKLNKKVMVYTYGYSPKKVLIVHGWAGRGTQLYELSDKILENKMMVISFDGPAHGLSEGKTTNMLEFIDSIQEIDKKYGPFEAVIGHSFGAMSLLNAIARNFVKTEKLVTLGADNSVTEVLKSYIAKLDLKPKIAFLLKLEFERKLQEKMKNYTSCVAAKKVTVPTLLIHDTQDKYVPVSSAIEIRQNLQNGELLITNGLGHHKIFKDKIIIERIINFIK
jgi:pimeloyl-ACP methyl ester carboxylesterase